MAHYAFLDEDNVVTEVITGRNEDEVVEGISDWEAHYGEFRGQICKRTSYNTQRNQHKTGGVPFRGNFAQRGFTYDEEKDIFVPPKPYPSWWFDEEWCDWKAPTPAPNNIDPYIWDEETTSWVLLTN